jgi:hypothetical protein
LSNRVDTGAIMSNEESQAAVIAAAYAAGQRDARRRTAVVLSTVYIGVFILILALLVFAAVSLEDYPGY